MQTNFSSTMCAVAVSAKDFRTFAFGFNIFQQNHGGANRERLSFKNDAFRLFSRQNLVQQPGRSKFTASRPMQLRAPQTSIFTN
jgi:hypothetical protein